MPVWRWCRTGRPVAKAGRCSGTPCRPRLRTETHGGHRTQLLYIDPLIAIIHIVCSH